MPTARLSDQQLFELLQNIPAGILVVDAQGYVTYANEAWVAIFGPEAAERITQAPLMDFYDVYVARTDERYPKERSPIFCAFKGEATRAQDIEVRFPDRTLFLDVAAAPIRDDEGKVAYAIANVIDITERVRVEDAYRDLFENTPMGIYRATAGGEIILANPAFLEMLGFASVEDMKSWNLDRERQHTSSDRSTFKRLLEEEGRVSSIETLLTKKDGNFVRVAESARAIRDSRNRVLFYEGTVEDITQRKSIEQELRRSREEYRYFIEKATDIIYRIDAKGFFRYVNPTVVKVLGFPEQEIIGKHFTDLIDPEYRAAALEFYAQQFRSKVPNTYYEFPVIAKNGDRVWIGQNVQPILTGEWILGFQAVARDISLRKEMESALARARDTALESARVKSEFLANMSHEIRTPLNGVVGMSDLLLRMTLTAEQREAAQTIRSSAEALLTLVDDILDLSKIEAGKLEIAVTDFDLDELVDTVTDMFAERAAAKGLKLRAVIYPDVERHLVGDAMRVRQVLINLVGNAIKFTDEGEVSLSVMQGDGVEPQSPDNVMVWFMVNDTGIGMTNAEQARLFTPFMQADGSTTRRFGGTGLGLAISKQLVDMMSGRIGVASVPEEGSTFWFTAPFVIDRRSELYVKKTALSGVRALLVDSDEMNRLMLRRHLISSSLTVEDVRPELVVSTLRHAAEHGTPFDVVVLEMQLEDTDGISVTREIHDDPVVGTTPIVLVTSIGRRQSDADFFRAERVDIWVMKPVRRAHLAAAVAQVVRREAVDEPQVPTAEPGSNAKARILIVEDNLINQKVAVGQLRLLGYEPEVLASGSAAIDATRRHPYDLILLDCQMPEMDGYDVSVAIRRMEDKTRRTPIIAMTAHTGEGEREKCIASGMDDFITKPVSTQRLGAVLARWLGHRERDVVDAAKVAGLHALARQNPTFMKDITGLFREDALIRLHELRDACAASNADALGRAAHALKSSSGNIGASRMYSICATLESSAKKGEIAGALEMVEELAEELDKAMEALTK